MLTFKDVFTGDELCSDSKPYVLIDDLIYEFEGKRVILEEGGGADEDARGEIDVVSFHRLQEVKCYAKPENFKSYIISYTNKMVVYLEGEGHSKNDVDEFRKKMLAWGVGLLAKERFGRLQFFVGETMAEELEGLGEGQVCIVENRDKDEGEVPYLMLVKAGLVEVIDV